MDCTYKVCSVWRPSLSYAIVTFRKVRHKSELNIHMVSCVGMYTRDSSWPRQLNTLERDRPQRDRSAAVRQAFQKCFCFDLFRTIKKCLSPKLRNLKLLKFFSVYMCVRTYVCMNACMYVCMDGWMGVYLFMWLQRTVYFVRWKTNSVQMSSRKVNECNKERRARFRIILFFFILEYLAECWTTGFCSLAEVGDF
jgi:hypothetical protein